MRMPLLVLALSLLTAPPAIAQTTSDQCIGVIYEDFTFVNVPFDSVAQLDSHKRYLRVRQTNFSVSGSSFRQDFVGDDEIAFKLLAGGPQQQRGLRLTRVILGASENQNTVRRDFYPSGQFGRGQTNLPGSARLTAVQSSFTLYTYPSDTTDFIARTDSASQIDIGSC